MTTIAWQSCLEVHPDTATTLGLENGDIVQVSSAAGQVEVPVYLYPAIRPDTVALALGQGHTDLGRYGRDRGVNGLALIGAGASPAEPVPVQLIATGRHAQIATFENVLGVREGFVNQDIPG
jgi:molybdopterin-containing oxidoreductase family iron-sulfur binding subunit